MDADLLQILCCPVSHQPLRMADPASLARAEQQTSVKLEEGLIREDGQLLYPVRQGIPLLIPEEGIPLA